MKVYKDNQHSVTLHPFVWQGRRYLMVCVGLYVRLDPAGGVGSLGTEQDFWKEAPPVFAALGQPPLLDLCLPKPAGEVLVAGFCRAPQEGLSSAQEVSFQVGGMIRRLAVFGDRQYLPGGGVSEPVPFRAMPLVWERAFGGPDFPLNPLGKGLDKDNRTGRELPNLEDPAHLLLAAGDRPQPACPFPLGADNPARRALSGTYDQAWLDKRWPRLPDDCSLEFFHSAQLAQRLRPLAGESPFFQGNEQIEITGMHHDYPQIRSRLPDLRIRAFALTCEQFVPFAPLAGNQTDGQPGRQGGSQANGQTGGQPGSQENSLPPLPYAKDLDAPGLFREVELNCDTIWLLPDLLGAFVLRRGLLPVEDDELDDVLRVMVVTEKADAPKQPLEYWREELKRRASPAVDIDLTPFIAAQGKISKAVKAARDLPKLLDKVKKNVLGQSPLMPLSLGDLSHAAQSSIASGRATLDQLERQMLAQREQFSHLISFDLSIFPKMRASLDAQEKNLLQTLADAEKEIQQAGEEMQAGLEAARKNAMAALLPPPDASPEEYQARTALARLGLKRLEELDKFTPEGLLAAPLPVNPWHDRGFALLIAARRCLRRSPALLARLADMGFDPATIEDVWLGWLPAGQAERPEDWGLPPGPAFYLPAGLVVPRFDGKTLIALQIYPSESLPAVDSATGAAPVTTEAPSVTTDSGPEAAARAETLELNAIPGGLPHCLAPGSAQDTLFLPAAHPPETEGGAVIIVPETLSARFAEQEAGDFCHVLAANSPEALLSMQEQLPAVGLLTAPAEEKMPVQMQGPESSKEPRLQPGDAALKQVPGGQMPGGQIPDGPAPDGPVPDGPAPDRQDAQEEVKPLPFLAILPPLPEGQAQREVWQQACPRVQLLHLPEGCPHVLALTGEGRRLRRLILDALPPRLAAKHDFDFPLPPKDKPMQAFTLNLPLPDKDEIQGRIEKLIQEIRAHFPEPQQMAEDLHSQARELVQGKFSTAPLSPEAQAGILAALGAPAAPPLPQAEAQDLAAAFATMRKELKAAKGRLPEDTPPALREQIYAALEEGEGRLDALEGELGPLAALRDEGMAKLEALKQGQLPEEVQASFAAVGMDPDAMRLLSREEVAAILANGKNLERRNLQGLDLSGLDFSGANLAHALCGKTRFCGCRMDEADFTFTLAAEADFSGASLCRAKFKQTVLQKAVFQEADFSEVKMELTTLGECDCRGARFDGAELNLCNFSKAMLEETSFVEAGLSLCALKEIKAAGADFRGLRAFKCLVSKAELGGADFSGAALSECLFQESEAVGLCLAGADLRKFYLDMESNFCRADFSGADLREASFRLSRLNGAIFYQARLDNALILQCDLSGAYLSGVQAGGLRLIKCELSGADLSGANLMHGELRKCRLCGTDLAGANLYGAALQGLILNKDTRWDGANLKRTLLAGKEKELKDAAQSRS